MSSCVGDLVGMSSRWQHKEKMRHVAGWMGNCTIPSVFFISYIQYFQIYMWILQKPMNERFYIFRAHRHRFARHARKVPFEKMRNVNISERFVEDLCYHKLAIYLYYLDTYSQFWKMQPLWDWESRRKIHERFGNGEYFSCLVKIYSFNIYFV